MKKEKQQELAINIKKEEDISRWYTQVIQKADLIEYTDVAGCMIFKPNSYSIWEEIQKYLDNEIKKMGVKNAYFPLFIPKKLLCKEEKHVEGFAPEVAWVDYGGDTKLGERLAIRPTSETIIYDAYSKWIQSYRDLPLKINQWCNVVRWEFKHPTPFLRTREFLWQEGHTVFASKEEAEKDVMQALEAYKLVYEDLLAIPVTLGRKSVGEKFAGADYSLTAEPFSYVDGKVIQACTSHYLGQNFSKAFNITFLDKEQKKQYPHQNSWGLSTRSIGSMILIHSDNKGLVLPPKVAREKIVIIPLLFKGKEEKVLEISNKIKTELIEYGPIFDNRKEYSPGFKYSEWEQKGIPIRIEIGPRDIENNSVIINRRDTNEKMEVKINEIKTSISQLLDEIQKNLFETAKKETMKKTITTLDFKTFEKEINDGKRCLVPWAEDIESEKKIKEKTGAKSSCIPFEFKFKKLEGVKCFYSKKPATCWAYFAKSY